MHYSFRQFAFIGILLLLVSCSRKISFEQSNVVPSAEGRVKLKKDRNGNQAIQVKTVRLAEAERLQPSRNTYVVWMETEDNGTKNIGQLKSSHGLFSKTLKGFLETVTPFKPVRFFITAEDDAHIQYPGMQVVLTTRHFR